MLDVATALAFVPNDSGDIRLATAISGVNTEDNLIYRAARLLQSHVNTPQGCDIYIEKQLPMGGGIGGGFI